MGTSLSETLVLLCHALSPCFPRCCVRLPTPATELGDFLLSQIFETWKMLLSFSHSPTLGEVPKQDTPRWNEPGLWTWQPLEELIVLFWSFVIRIHPCGLLLPVIPQVFVGQEENQITGRGAQDGILPLFCSLPSPFFLLSCLSEWLLYAKLGARCWVILAGTKKQKSHHNGTHNLRGQANNRKGHCRSVSRDASKFGFGLTV